MTEEKHAETDMRKKGRTLVINNLNKEDFKLAPSITFIRLRGALQMNLRSVWRIFSSHLPRLPLRSTINPPTVDDDSILCLDRPTVATTETYPRRQL